MWIDHFASTSIDCICLHTNPSDISRMSGDGDDLESICSNNGTPANLFSAIVTTGWSVSTIALGFSDASEFDQEATLRDLGITEDISRLERAALKVVWAQCKQIFNASQAPSTGSAPAVEVPMEEVSKKLSFGNFEFRLAAIQSTASIGTSDRIKRFLAMGALEASNDIVT